MGPSLCFQEAYGGHGPRGQQCVVSVVKSMVLKDTRALGLPEEAWSPRGPIWGESISLMPEPSLEGKVGRRRALDGISWQKEGAHKRQEARKHQAGGVVMGN